MSSNMHQTDSSQDTFNGLMNLGAAAHTAGDGVNALTAFESALALSPQDTQAVSACAALLFELSRPRAAFALLKSIEGQLLINADGCSNLGLAALACGQPQAAAAYFEIALKLQPTHPAALTHLGLLAARDQCWSDAIAHARQCVTCMPSDETAHTNLMDYLLGARRTTEALEQWNALPAHLKNHPQLAIRQVVALALNAEFDAAKLAMVQLSPQALNDLANFLQRGGAADLPGLFYRHALKAIQDCDWSDYARLSTVIGEDALHQGVQAVSAHGLLDKTRAPPPFSAIRRAAKSAVCIHIGIAATALRDASATQSLAAELSLYDSAKFKFHIYSPTPQPQAVLSAALAAHQVVEIAHFTDEEAVWRIRLDRLDLWFDLTLNTPWHRLYIAQCRVAPLQVLPLPATRPLPTGIFVYALSDRHLQAVSNSNSSQTALARLPHAGWFADCSVASTAAPVSRKAAGLTLDAFVVCVFGPCAQITPKIFALWMRLLKLMPHAVLWLSPCSRVAQANLRREATQADVMAERLFFAPAAANLQALLPLADLYLDAVGQGNAQTLIQALQMGVPAVAATSGVANSVLSAAGLQECIFENPETCLSGALHLVENPAALRALRERMQSSMAQSPLFDAPNRASEKATAWKLMVERSRSGLMPATFEVPLAGQSNQRAN